MERLCPWIGDGVMAVRDVVQAAAGVGGGDNLYVEDVFSTYLYTGNGATQNIENGIALGDSNYGPSVEFDGTNDYLSRSSDMTGNADGKTFTFSCWLYKKSDSSYSIYNNRNASGYGFQVFASSSTKITIYATNASGTAVLNMQNSTSEMSLYTWTHILISMDLSSASNRSVYINDVDKTSSFSFSAYSNDNIDFTQGDHFVASRLATDAKFDGRLSNVFLDYTYRDLSVTNNRRLFITEDGKPADGQAGLNPIMYMPLDDPEDIGYNAGTGGDFTVNGVMARSGRGPNQYNAAASTFESGDNVKAASLPNITSTGYTISVNVKTDLSSQSIPFWVEANSTNVQAQLSILTTGVLRFNAADYNTSSTIMRITADEPLSAGRWYNIQAVIDPAVQANNKLYVDGVEVDVTFVTFVSRTNHILSQNAQVGNATGSEISDVWFADTKVDLSTDNPFYDTETDKPKYLGESGELPTGSSPLIYLPLRANDAGNNLGTGGDFTVNSGPFTGARGPSEFIGRSATFADNKSLERSSLGTLSDGKVFYIAFAVKPSVSTDNNTGNIIYFADSATNDNFIIRKTETQDNLELVVYNGTTATDVNRYASNNNALSSGAWHTVLFTDDLSVTNKSKRELWINGTKINSWGSSVNADLNIPFSSFDRFRVSNSSFSAGIQGSIGFLAFDTTYLDFSQEANRLKFFDAFGYPVDLGEDGSAPTGNQPLIYINNDFHLGTNLGSGGDFTPTNTPTAGSDVGS